MEVVYLQLYSGAQTMYQCLNYILKMQWLLFREMKKKYNIAKILELWTNSGMLRTFLVFLPNVCNMCGTTKLVAGPTLAQSSLVM